MLPCWWQPEFPIQSDCCVPYKWHWHGRTADRLQHRGIPAELLYNSLLVNCSNRNLDKLQRVQNNLARVICNSNRSTSAGPLLRSLHWLPDRQRINFKLAKLCYLVTSFQQPGYLADMISPYSQSRLLRSSTQKLVSSAAQLGHCCSSFLYCCSETLELSSTELSNCSIR